MIHLIVPSTIGLGLGSFLGKHLSQQGITAENALDKHQTTARVIFAVIVAIITPFIIIEHYNLGYHLPRVFPQIIFISLYSQAFCDELLLLFGFFTLGFLLFLELSGGSIATLARISGKHPQITEKEVTIGNPLGGIEIRNFKRFQDYWFGEVIFVS
ncbi:MULTISPECIES: hypothetical protein [Crocosphaera]|uniref:Uncharacterized protein n=4 Tax=Crocosphaera watsonii TaxID=263511 RepID=T2JMR1_CROWT|nr:MULTISPECIES: hypothetical protein [Crocosphaera]EHJ10172.1 hypothetical protein CWATWH0003_5071 [Crocosphaera watsonii WH 0003]MCH2244887.1 hypothetical protein [Crocosphaera sp.]CCQ54569.1 hypothetical protein CWATWH0005_1627 [Crocosphaera watsonii WH 0005]CCQ63847.1 hypothetical protein CWATWH0401_1773 [Crocosphaera watsonii WH 0401]CCQ66545.1 hypothetical protein CWATWH0402_32 [Crocosphaera watsonii WH 0402]